MKLPGRMFKPCRIQMTPITINSSPSTTPTVLTAALLLTKLADTRGRTSTIATALLNHLRELQFKALVHYFGRLLNLLPH